MDPHGSPGFSPFPGGSAPQETPAQRDAAEAGAEAARLAAADSRNAQQQIDAAAVAAGRAATNGGMDAVGAEEAARKAATWPGGSCGRPSM